MRIFTVTLCAVLLSLVLAMWAPNALAKVEIGDPGGGGDPATSEYVRDYQAVRKVGLALAVLGFLLGVGTLGTTEFPAERHRAESLMTLTVIVFVLLAGDRMLARGVATWFSFPTSALPVFWQ